MAIYLEESGEMLKGLLRTDVPFPVFNLFISLSVEEIAFLRLLAGVWGVFFTI